MSLKLMSAIINTTQASQACSENLDSEKILKTLLDYVKQCQIRFGGKTELATEYEHCVTGLCSWLDAVLLHGLRSKPLEVHGSALKQVSDIVSSSLSFHNGTPSYWPFVIYHLTKHEQERYSVLRNIWTDIGRGRAWIRSSLNERSLERYFHCILSNADLLKKYYEDWAILCDQEKSAMLPNMAAGLAPILFAISIDKEELNNEDFSVNRLKNQSEPIIITESSSVQKNESKKKKRVQAQLILFGDDEEDDKSCLSYTSGSSVSQEKNLTDSQLEYTTSKSDEPTVLAKKTTEVTVEPEPSTTQTIPDTSNTLTSVQYADIGVLIPVATNTEQFDPESPVDAIEIPTDIVEVLTNVENKNKEEQNQLLEKLSILTKENEKLQVQLKRYISAVQLLKFDKRSAQEALADLSLSQDEVGEEVDYIIQAKMFENKLVQVAEMHGELMEFNDHLQKTLCQKESHLQRLCNELTKLGSPMSTDKLNLETEANENTGFLRICVPSVFLTGSGSEAHHVYQIYIRAGNDDWNIYRRYAQFYALHSELKKLDSAVAAYDFPPKKSLRNKDANLVEDRRRRLQTYLRRIIAHWPELGNCNSRYLLESHLSFFRDQPNEDNKPKDKTKKGVFLTKKTTQTNTDNHYTGL